jgi:hypothetical protein
LDFKKHLSNKLDEHFSFTSGNVILNLQANCPAEQFMGRNEAFAQRQVLFTVRDHALGQLACMRQKEADVEGACGSQHLCRRIKGGSFLAIGTSLVSPLSSFFNRRFMRYPRGKLT